MRRESLRRIRWTRCLSIAACAANIGACQTANAPSSSVAAVSDSGATYFPQAEWRTESPAAVGFDAARLDNAVRDVSAGRYGSMHGVLVVRFGYLVLEHYEAWDKSRVHTMQSVTKSVTSLLFGIVRNKVSSEAGNLDRPVLDVFKKYSSVANVDDRKRALTLRHLMTMRTSMDFWEQPYPGSPLDQLNRSSDDWVKFVLDRPMTGTPGSEWAYNSGAAITMGGVIRELSATNVDEFARRELFAPIGATGETWAKSPYDGLPHCGGGLNLKPPDLARVGYLVLRHGRWGDREIVPSAWLDLTTAPVTRGSPVFFSSYGSAYGYFWWLFPTRRGGTDTGIIAASGSGGQWLFVIPSLDLVVAIVAADGNGLDLLYDGILPALRQ
jgi:CubicO group peptidase (beta-lactamase class C family)